MTTATRPNVLSIEAWKKVIREGGEAPADTALRKSFSNHIDKAGIDVDKRTVPFVISTAGVDRDEDTIAVDGWRLDNYKANPVVLWAHDYSQLPVAKAIEVAAFNGSLKAIDQFATREVYPFADTVFQLIVQGYLNATSVGFIPLKWEIAEDRDEGMSWFPPVNFTEQELLEHSIVPVPSNPEALIEARSKGIDLLPLKGWAEAILDTLGGESGLWLPRSRVEQAMKVIDTKTVHAGAAPVAIDKSGRVLSAANETRVMQARDLLTEVLDQLASEEDADDKSKSVPAPPVVQDEEDVDLSEIEVEVTTADDDGDIDLVIDSEELRHMLRDEFKDSLAHAMTAVTGKLPE